MSSLVTSLDAAYDVAMTHLAGVRLWCESQLFSLGGVTFSLWALMVASFTVDFITRAITFNGDDDE